MGKCKLFSCSGHVSSLPLCGNLLPLVNMESVFEALRFVDGLIDLSIQRNDSREVLAAQRGPQQLAQADEAAAEVDEIAKPLSLDVGYKSFPAGFERQKCGKLAFLRGIHPPRRGRNGGFLRL
ncbi:hypothetical protein MPLSOD_110120 [Mesorhizobium sp. SOD10]|nr:hypothetical protein MPLSOD_110120 [Mesorhizobium sp. SOD10]